MLKVREIKFEDYVYASLYSLSDNSTHSQSLAFPAGMELFLSVQSGPLILFLQGERKCLVCLR